MRESVRQAVAATLGSPIVGSRAVSGGDINEAFAATLEDGREVFIKSNPRAPSTLFPAEAKGLAWLADAEALRTPAVLGVSAAGAPPESCFLALELLTPAPRQPDFDHLLGESLARLHQAPPTTFGLNHANFIGSLPQSNTPHSTWVDFFRDERLLPQVTLARKSGHFSASDVQLAERLATKLDSLTGPVEPPARLHGDLWGGNLFVDEHGAPCLIDPAVYGGHREMDLAMMRLFGGFGARVFDAYHAVYPLAPGAAERVPLYQLYPTLVHVNLFGGGYVSSARRILQRYL
jgi:fructosamine-3-kinase